MDDSGANPFNTAPADGSACGSACSCYESAGSVESIGDSSGTVTTPAPSTVLSGGSLAASLGGAPPMPPPAAPPAAPIDTVPVVPVAPADMGISNQSFQDLDISSGPAGGSTSQAAARFDATVGGAAPGGGASPDLAVSVANPSKVGDGINSYFTYEVTTKTSLPQYAHGQFVVTRRFRDFDWLHNQLVSKYPGAIVPPLPEKHAAQVSTMKVTGVTQSAAWLEERRSQLQHFLHKLVAHPMLHAAPDLQAFLEKEGDALEAWKELSKAPKGGASYSLSDVKNGLLSSYSKSMSLFGGEGVSAAFTPVEDVPCQQMANYAAAVQGQVTAVHKHSKSYIDRHRALGQSMTGFGLALTQLANCETAINESLAKGISSMGLCVGRLSATYSELAEREADAFEEPMKEYIRLLTAVKTAIAARDAALRSYNASSSSLLAKKERLDKLRASGGKEDKISALSREMTEAEEAENLAKSHYETVSARVDGEMARFQSEKLTDLKRCVTTFLRLQIEYSERIQAAWRDLLPRLEEIDSQ